MRDGPPRIFDRRAYAQHRARAERLDGDRFLAREAALRLAERIAAVNRRFEHALDLSSRTASFSILEPVAERWIRTGLPGAASAGDGIAAEMDEEAVSFAEESFDLVTSVLSLHTVNDLPGALIQIRRCLKPDGLFMAALFADATLTELRNAFADAEIQTRGGISPRVAPFSDVRELGGLLQRAGFASPVADSERTTVRYRVFTKLVTDLRELGETSALSERPRLNLTRTVAAAAALSYSRSHADEDGALRATFDIVYLSGWSPHESQQKPLQPGSAKSRLADALARANAPEMKNP